MKKFITVVLVLFVFGSVSVFSDVYIKQKSHTDAISMMGQNQPAKDEVNETWIGKDKFAMITSEMSIIIDLSVKKMYFVTHTNKSYVPMDLPLDLEKYFPAQMMQMMQGITVKVTPSGESKTINQWKCDGYDTEMNIMMMKMKMKIWASTDVPFDWKEFNEKMYPLMSQAMFRLDEKAMEEFKKINGYQIRQDISMDMMGTEMKSWTEVVEITKKSAPAGIYSPPEGYTKQDKIDMMNLR